MSVSRLLAPAVALFALWWAFVGEWSWQAAVWGLGLSLTATVAASVVRRVGLPRLPAPPWLAELVSVPRQVVVDLALLSAVLWNAVRTGDRSTQGKFVRRPAPSAAGESDQARLRRAWLTLLATYSPNAYVVDVDADAGEALLHDLRVRRASEAPV